MAIHIVQGDLLQSDCNVICHQANCFKTMGAGIAKQIAHKYPEVYQADMNFELSAEERLGRISGHLYPDIPLLVVNLYGQYKYGRGVHTDMLALGHSLHQMFQHVKTLPFTPKIGMPYGMGAGLAGGDWETVYNMIQFSANYYGYDIYLYKL